MSTATFNFTASTVSSPFYFRMWWPASSENASPGWKSEITFNISARGGVVVDTTSTPGTPTTIAYIETTGTPGGYVYIVPTSPGSGAISLQHINWLCTATINDASPAGVGKCSVTWDITCRDAGGSTLSTFNYVQNVPNVYVAGYELLVFPGGAALAALESYAALADVSLTTTLPNRHAATMGSPTSGKDRAAILFPREGNISIDPQDGTQYVSRRVPEDIATTPDTDWWAGNTTRYMRRSPDDAWAVIGTASYDPPEIERPLTRMAHVAYYAAKYATRDSLTLPQYVFDAFEPQVQSPGAGIYRADAHYSGPDDLQGHVWLDWHSADELWARVGTTSALVDSNMRGSSDTGCLPHPWIYRGADGTWIIGALCGSGNYKEWRADEIDGAAWSLVTTQTLGSWADLDGAQWAQGRDGRQVIIGGSGVYSLLHRAGDGETWQQGTQTWDYSGLCSTPYVYERPDGTWEAGWLDVTTETWHTWTALDPAGTWTEE